MQFLCYECSRYAEYLGLSCKQKRTLDQIFDDLQEACGNSVAAQVRCVDGKVLDQIYEILEAGQTLTAEEIRPILPSTYAKASVKQALKDWLETHNCTEMQRFISHAHVHDKLSCFVLVC